MCTCYLAHTRSLTTTTAAATAYSHRASGQLDAHLLLQTFRTLLALVSSSADASAACVGCWSTVIEPAIAALQRCPEETGIQLVGSEFFICISFDHGAVGNLPDDRGPGIGFGAPAAAPSGGAFGGGTRKQLRHEVVSKCAVPHLYFLYHYLKTHPRRRVLQDANLHKTDHTAISHTHVDSAMKAVENANVC